MCQEDVLNPQSPHCEDLCFAFERVSHHINHMNALKSFFSFKALMWGVVILFAIWWFIPGLLPGSSVLWKISWPKTNFDKSSVDRSEIISGGPRKDGIPSIDKPTFKPVAEVDLAPPTPGGWIDPAEIERRLQDDTALVSIMWVNNELGTINDIAAIGEMCRDRGILFYCDGSQAAGKIQLDLESIPIDAFCACAHKMNGPKGAAALVLQGRAAGRPIEPLIEGGGQEHGLRSGTLDVPAIVGFGAAASRVRECLDDDTKRITQFRDTLQAGIIAAHPNAVVNGLPSHRVPHILNMTIPTSGPASLAEQLQGVACSAGAACPSTKSDTSHVLAAIGLGQDVANATVRLSLGRRTTSSDISTAIEAIERVGN